MWSNIHISAQHLFPCCRQADTQVLLCQVKLVLSTSSHYGHSWRLTRCPTHYVPPPLIGVVSQVWHDCRRFVLLHGRTVAFATDGLIVGLIGWAVKATRRSDQPSPPLCVPWFSPWYQGRANHTCSQPQSYYETYCRDMIVCLRDITCSQQDTKR